MFTLKKRKWVQLNNVLITNVKNCAATQLWALALIIRTSFSMALVRFFTMSSFFYKDSYAKSGGFKICKPLYSSESTPTAITTAQSLVRRSANYKVSLWPFDHIESLSTKYKARNISFILVSLLHVIFNLLVYSRI